MEFTEGRNRRCVPNGTDLSRFSGKQGGWKPADLIELSVNKKQPFLSGFPTQICGRARRRLQDVIAAQRRKLADSSIASYALQFSHILPADVLHGFSASQRVRHYCNVVVFWAWLAQILEANASLSKAVSLVQAWCADCNLPIPGSDTGAYSRARSRLGLAFLFSVHKRINDYLTARIKRRDTYQGHVVKSIDGSTFTLDDTEANQAAYPQPCRQKKGCGFPVMGAVGILNHSHGGWEDFICQKHTAHDTEPFHKLLHCLDAGDILCGDRAFCTYEIKSTLQQKGVFTLMRLHQARERGLKWNKGQKIDHDQRLFIWKKPSQPAGSKLDAKKWKELPDELEIRLIRFYFIDRYGKKRRMILATTLTDHEKYDWKELAALYAQRWDIELRLRDVKTTLRLEHLRVKTPEMAHKVLRMSLIAYNLVKSGCQEAAHSVGEDLRLISFKGALDTIVANTSRYQRRQRHTIKIREIWDSIIEIISQELIDSRPFRREPRAVKKRPKNFDFLTKPRAVFQEVPYRGRNRRAA